MKKENEPTFKEVMHHFNIDRHDGTVEYEEREGQFLEPIDAYKLGKVIMRLEKEVAELKGKKRVSNK